MWLLINQLVLLFGHEVLVESLFIFMLTDSNIDFTNEMEKY